MLPDRSKHFSTDRFTVLPSLSRRQLSSSRAHKNIVGICMSASGDVPQKIRPDSPVVGLRRRHGSGTNCCTSPLPEERSHDQREASSFWIGAIGCRHSILRRFLQHSRQCTKFDGNLGIAAVNNSRRTLRHSGHRQVNKTEGFFRNILFGAGNTTF